MPPAAVIRRAHPRSIRATARAFFEGIAPHRAALGRARQMEREFPDFVDLLVLTVRAGHTPLQAIGTLVESVESVESTLGDALRAVLQRVNHGARFAEAIGELPTRVGSVAQPVADALALCDRYGTPLAPMLDRLAAEAHAQRRRSAEAAARKLPIRLSFPLVGFTLPSFVLLTIVPLMAGAVSSLQGTRH